MKQALSLLCLGSEELAKDLKSKFKKTYAVTSPKNLVRALIDRDVDFVVIEEGHLSLEKVRKVFATYSCPFFIVYDQSPEVEDEYGIYHLTTSQVARKFAEMDSEVRNIKFRRRNEELLELLDAVKTFEIALDDLNKDRLVKEVNTYFEKLLKVKQGYWVEIQEPNVNLPPILRCKAELQRQEVNLSSVVKELDDCIVEVVSEDSYQVWKKKSGGYLALFWLEDGDRQGQCVLLNGIEFFSIRRLRNQLDYLVPILSRRWALSLTVEKAQVEVFQDSLTNLYNQRYLHQILDQKMEEEKRYKTPFTILFIDVDHFKKVNDSKGHVVGSSVLVALGQLLETCIRATDFAFRYGGDEFIILLGHTDGELADIVAERIRHKVEQEKFSTQGEIVNITVSIGLASYPKHASSAEEIIQIADEAMYYGKNKSRNIVYKASS